jgi:hypothetical protein
MAEPEKKEESKSLLIEIVALLIGLYFLSLVIERTSFLVAHSQYGLLNTWWSNLAVFISSIAWPLWKGMAVILITGSVFGIWRLYLKFGALVAEEKETYGSVANVHIDGEVSELKNEKWERIIELINSANEADWRLAIIEADVMLEDLLRRASYHGETLGEMLRSVEKSDMLTLESAWEAHKIRNAIAHRGSEFPLTEREAKRAISLFEEVFQEFKII